MSISSYQKIVYLERAAVRMVNWSLNTSEEHNEESLITNVQFQKLMKISRSTSYRWRAKKIIEYYQTSKKIYFSLKDVVKLLLDNYSEIYYDRVCTFGDLIPVFNADNTKERIRAIKPIKK
jgi:hypothetical protein